MQTNWKYLIALILLGLLFWLLFEPNNDEARIEKLSQALKTGTIGRLNFDEEKQFENEIKVLCQIAGVSQPVEINYISSDEKDFKSKLHVFITSGAADITHCTKGNAVFDAQVNCIFIDLSLFRPIDWMIYQDGIQLNSGDLPFLATYRRFIVLHELGHYKLHKTSGGYFDLHIANIDKQSREKEIEADSFAVLNWGKYMKSQPADDYLGGSINFGDFPRSNANNTAVSLLEMGNNITLGMLYGLSPYSPFYSDAAHPTYLDRIKTLIYTITNQPNVDKTIKARAWLMYAMLNRTQQIAQHEDVAEIATSDPILDINFNDKGLIILPYTTGEYYSIPFDDLKELKNLGQIKSYQIPNNYRHQTQPLIDSNAKETLFSLKGSGTYCSSDNKLFQLSDNGFLNISDTPFGKLFQDATTLYLPVQPGNKAIIVSDSIFYVVFKPGQIIQRKITEFNKDIREKLGSDGRLDFFGTLINEDDAAVPIFNDSSYNKLTGIALINLKDLQTSIIPDFKLPENFFNNGEMGRTGYSNGENQYLYSLDPLKSMVIRLRKEKDVSLSWQIFSASGNDAGQLVLNVPFISNDVKGDRNLLGDFYPEMYRQGITPVGKNQFLLNWNGDSIFLINTQNHSVKLVFNPGDETIKIRVSDLGYVAIFIQGVKKFYLLKL